MATEDYDQGINHFNISRGLREALLLLTHLIDEIEKAVDKVSESLDELIDIIEPPSNIQQTDPFQVASSAIMDCTSINHQLKLEKDALAELQVMTNNFEEVRLTRYLRTITGFQSTVHDLVVSIKSVLDDMYENLQIIIENCKIIHDAVTS